MPVKNQIIPLTIDTLTNGGFGIGRYEGMAVFVPYSAVGDVLTVKILKVKKSYCYAKIHSIETPSPDRIENDCPVFGRCGGCDFRHISYEAEIRAKEQFIKDAFGQFSVLNPAFLPLLPFESPYRYRNKSQYPVGKNKEGQLHYGYYQANSHRIVPCDDCLLLPKDIVEIASFVAEFARNNGISPYDEAAHKGVLRHIFVRKGHYSGETNVCIVARRKVPEFYLLAKRLMQKFPSVKGVVLNINPEKTNVILGEKELLLSGKPTITDTLCGFSVEISPKSVRRFPLSSALKCRTASLSAVTIPHFIRLRVTRFTSSAYSTADGTLCRYFLESHTTNTTRSLSFGGAIVQRHSNTGNPAFHRDISRLGGFSFALYTALFSDYYFLISNAILF